MQLRPKRDQLEMVVNGTRIIHAPPATPKIAISGWSTWRSMRISGSFHHGSWRDSRAPGQPVNGFSM
jgi:hypothetical protein